MHDRSLLLYLSLNGRVPGHNSPAPKASQAIASFKIAANCRRRCWHAAPLIMQLQLAPALDLLMTSIRQLECWMQIP